MAIFRISYQTLSTPPLDFVLGPPADVMPETGAPSPGRTDTRWHLTGPTVTISGVGNSPSEYFLYGVGLGTLGALPLTGTITSILHFTTVINDGPLVAEDGGLLVSRVFSWVDGLSLTAAQFAAAEASNAILTLLLSGDDEIRSPSTLTPFTNVNGLLRGGTGSDTIYGGSSGTLLGESGDDQLILQSAAPHIPSGVGYVLDGGDGDDSMVGAHNHDTLLGGEGGDRLQAGRGDDLLIGHLGRDVHRGEAGNDTIYVAAGGVEPGEVIDGGADTDTLWAEVLDGSPFDLSEAQIQRIETLRLSGDLRLTRDQVQGFTRIEFGGISSITLADAGFTDLTLARWYENNPLASLTVIGSAGRDVINGRDTFDVGPPGDGAYPFAVSADDSIRGALGNDVLNGGSGNDTLLGEAGNDLLRGDGGIDLLVGGEGADTLDTGGNPTPPFSFQNDVLEGGPGNDTYVVRHFNATIVEVAGGGTDTLVVHNAWTLPSEIEHLTIGTTTALNGFGNALANRMTGNDAFNNLSGAEGNDTLLGRGAGDVLDGGDGSDSLDGGDGDDGVIGGLGLDRLRGGAGVDRFLWFAEQESTPTTRDQILDFVSGEDLIVLVDCDADALQAGLQPFTFIGNAAFTAGQPGQLRYQEVNATSSVLFGSTDNDIAPEFAVLVVGTPKITEADLLLS